MKLKFFVFIVAEIEFLSTLFHTNMTNISRDIFGKSVAKRGDFGYNDRAVLGGELAVPCICNPL